VIVVDAMPRTSTGKIQKNRLREEHVRHYGA
jgi:acyl-CoA synthetase (AMP-forming)/AMP-acid ligase II